MIRFRGNKLVIRLCLPNQSFHFLSVEALECKSYNYKSLVEGLNVINGPKCNKVLNVITFCPKCNKVLNVITICPKCNKLLSCH